MEYTRTIVNNPWIPKPEPFHGPHARQRQCLLLADIMEVFYGGAGGGGKSHTLLTAAAQYVDTPGYSAILFRENYKDLTHPEDGLITKSKQWWGKLSVNGHAARWSEKLCRWEFPSGATIQFGYLEHDNDVEQYRGGSRQFVAFDELTQHTEFRYRFFFGWLRKPGSGPLTNVPLRYRSGSNPGGKGHEWVKNRFINEGTREPGAVFVSARLEDNPSIDLESYDKSQSMMDPILRAQVRRGDWDAYSGGRFLRHWFRRWEKGIGPNEYRLFNGSGQVKFIPAIGTGSFRMIFQTVDPAASEATTADYTVIATWALTHENELVWLDCERFQKAIPDIPPAILMAYKKWNPAFVAIEAVAANNAVAVMCMRLPMMVKTVSPQGKDKLTRATPAMVFASEGRVYLPINAHWLDDVESELLRFTGDEDVDAHDDIVDVFSYACAVLQGRMTDTDRPKGAGKSAPYMHRR